MTEKCSCVSYPTGRGCSKLNAIMKNIRDNWVDLQSNEPYYVNHQLQILIGSEAQKVILRHYEDGHVLDELDGFQVLHVDEPDAFEIQIIELIG